MFLIELISKSTIPENKNLRDFLGKLFHKLKREHIVPFLLSQQIIESSLLWMK